MSLTKRVRQERDYWNICAKDPSVNKKYISDIDAEGFLNELHNVKGKVLEIGCGVGRLMKPKWYGIDISANMIKIAKKRQPYGKFKVNNGRTIPYKDGFFDFVYSILLFQHIPFEGVKSYIHEASRVLKNQGVFMFQFIKGTEQEPFSIHHNEEKVKEELEKAHFVLIQQKEGLVHDHWTWISAIKTLE